RSALGAFEEACAKNGDWTRLERQYRKLIHRLTDRDPHLVLELWWRLGDCYRDRFDDYDKARVAYEVARKLAPEETRLHQALAAVTLADPMHWREATQALRARFRLAPTDPAPLRQLAVLHATAGRHEAAQLTIQALVAAGSADEAERERYQ